VGQKQSFALKLLISVVAVGSFSTAFAGSSLPSCGVASLASYITTTANPPASGGCAIGILDYFDFSYHPVSNAPLASAINVSPSVNGSGFSFGPVTAAAGQTVQFEIDYDLFIDPAPIITGDNLGLDPPTGNVVVTEYFCNDISYIGGGLCALSQPAPSLTVGTPGTGFPYPSATITFAHPATTSQNVGIVFTLTGGATGASFDGLDTVSLISGVPEPASAGGLLGGLLVLAGGYKLRKQRTRLM
jgi:hypothetical protein